MRITNDDYSPIQLLAELTTRRGTTSEDTCRFFQEPRSKHDWLVEEWANRIDSLLASFKRYGLDVNPTQFVRDQGIDVLLRVSDHLGRPWRLGLQVKSNLEAKRDREKKAGQENMIGTLKRQAHDARERVDEWWVMCCFDMTQYHSLVQSINSELTGGKQNSWIRVIDPMACASVLRMSNAEVDAFCTLFLCRDDEVLSSARSEVRRYHQHVATFVLDHLAKGLEGQFISRKEVAAFLQDAQQQIEEERAGYTHDLDINEKEDVEDESTELHELLAQLEGSGFISAGIYDEDYRMVPATFPGLCALFFEARVRHDLDADAATAYMRLLTLERLP